MSAPHDNNFKTLKSWGVEEESILNWSRDMHDLGAKTGKFNDSSSEWLRPDSNSNVTDFHNVLLLRFKFSYSYSYSYSSVPASRRKSQCGHPPSLAATSTLRPYLQALESHTKRHRAPPLRPLRERKER
ncbi:hypothetical protein V496_04095 [Pseudogymnoascus sp. VKM F-4515 (FW-2607)]|nr:hypothetical protein V496_04095 [Pseudogymnoascus sp. VKM F-4515 (FW-2607)]